MPYDTKTIGAVIEMASATARRELIQSAFVTRDYAFLDAVFETSGVEHLNKAATTRNGSLGSSMTFDHPLELAVTDDDPTLLEWTIEKDLELCGTWFSSDAEHLPPKLGFAALAQAFALERKSMVAPLLALTKDGEPTVDFLFARGMESIKFQKTNEFGIASPGGNTPLTCALVNGWDDLVGQYIGQTRRTHELDLMMAVKLGSEHIEHIAAKIGGLEFPEPMRAMLRLLDEEQRAHYFDVLQRAGLPIRFVGSNKLLKSFDDSVRSVEECRFLLDNNDVCSILLSEGLDPVHNMLGVAVRNNRLDVVKWLVEERGADPNFEATERSDRKSGHRPPIFKAQGEVLDYLVRAGADLNVVGNGYATPLIEAVKANNAFKVGQLIELGADAAIKFEGRSARQLAKSDEMREMLRAMRVSVAVGAQIACDGNDSPGRASSAPAPL